MKRQRGRGRKPGGGHHQPNRSLESSGPDIKVRGTAAHIYERYLQLARDATSSGDRVMSENYLQHAEHYFRVLRSMQGAMPAPQHGDRYGAEHDGDDEGSDGEGGEGDNTAESGDQPEVEGGYAQSGHAQSGHDGPRGDGEFRRRRPRRNRFRPGGEGGDRDQSDEAPARETQADGEAAPAPQRRPRNEGRQERSRDRDAKRGGGEDGGEEGFSSGPTPAFIASE